MSEPTTEPPVDRQQPARLTAINPVLATLLSVFVGLLIAIGEIDHLIAQVLDTNGRTWSPTQLTSPGAVFSPRETHDGWSFLFDKADVHEWLIGYASLDALLVLTYTALLLWWTTRLGTARPLATPLVLIAGASDLLENALIGFHCWPTGLMVLTAIKWVALLAAVAVLVVVSRRAMAWRSLRLLLLGFYTHRYSALIVVPLAALGLARGPDILEQVPDIQRRWADAGEGFDFWTASVTMLALTAAVFVIGRLRTHHLWHRTQPKPSEPQAEPLILIWFIGPALLLAGAFLTDRAGADISRTRLWIFVGVPLLIGIGSVLLKYWRPTWKPPTRRGVGLDRFFVASLVGDLLPGLLPIVAGLGAVRAFTAVVALGEGSGKSWTLLVLGVLAIVATWPVYTLVLHQLVSEGAHVGPAGSTRRARLIRLLTPGVEHAPAPAGTETPLQVLRRQWAPWTILMLSVAGLAGLGLFPVPVAHGLGVIATFQLSLGALTLAIAATVILFQPGGAPHIFWRTGPAFVPVTSLVVGAVLLAAAFGGGRDVHGVRLDAGVGNEQGADSRPGLSDVFASWLKTGDECAMPLPGVAGTKVRPMLLYAAEGGGIRATYWTTSGVDKIANAVAKASPDAPPSCGGAFLSSGASGGSVGLAIASVSDQGAARTATIGISGPDALGAAVDGMVLRDALYAATGVPLPSFHTPGTDVWLDRAALIEKSWEKKIPGLTGPWLTAHSDWDWGPSGAMVLNSTSSTNGCRALISQLKLPTSDVPTVCPKPTSVAGSMDLVDCTNRELSVSTAALLTARFPYVTPSGALHCGDDDQQIVDGGYAENTGVGTLVDLAPQLLDEVRGHNACVLAGASPNTECGKTALDTLVVPMVVYFDNGTGSDLAAPRPKPILEILVPPVTAMKAKKSLYSPKSQLERAAAAFATDQVCDGTSAKATKICEAVSTWRGDAVYVLYQPTKPGLAAPLGWALSQTSMTTMDEAIKSKNQEQVKDLGGPGKLRYGYIDELLSRLTPP